MPGLDLNQIVKLFTRRGERVVVILPEGEPVVLVPLSEYEKMSVARPASERAAHRLHDKPTPAAPPTGGAKPSAVAAPAESLEPVDPPQGGLADDDQYYPEPLEA